MAIGNAMGSIRGRTARASGRSFERDLDLTHASYAKQGCACLGRGHPEVGGTPGRTMFFKAKADVDYFGVADSRAIAFDAKSRAGEMHFAYDPRDMHQLDFLIRFHQAGGIGCILVRDDELDRVYLLGRDAILMLRAGYSVELRRDLRGASTGDPLVPCLIRDERQQLEATARGTPIWPWLEALRMIEYNPRLFVAPSIFHGEEER